jgi:hypothetical protein
MFWAYSPMVRSEENHAIRAMLSMLTRVQPSDQRPNPARGTRRGLKKTPAQYLTENLVVTCSGNFSAAAFLCTVMALGVKNVLFSVDWRTNPMSRQ